MKYDQESSSSILSSIIQSSMIKLWMHRLECLVPYRSSWLGTRLLQNWKGLEVPTWTRTGVPSKVAKRAWSRGKIFASESVINDQQTHCNLQGPMGIFGHRPSGPFRGWFTHDRSSITCLTFFASTGRGLNRHAPKWTVFFLQMKKFVGPMAPQVGQNMVYYVYGHAGNPSIKTNHSLI